MNDNSPEEGKRMLTVEGLRAQHQSEQKPAPAFRRASKQYATNKFAGKCSRCGGRVEAEQGFRDKDESGKWIVFHDQCPTQQQTLPVGDAVARSDHAVGSEVTVSSDIPVKRPLVDGYYTVVFEDGEHCTIRVRTQYADAKFKPGEAILSYLSGPSNESDYTSFANITDRGYVRIWRKHSSNTRVIEAAKVLAGDPKAAMKAYGLNSGHCGVCGRLLTDPDSIAAGIGPVCMGKAWS